MKKMIFLSMVAAGFTMASCKKDYSCDCTTTTVTNIGGGSETNTSSASTDIKDKKDEAEASCKLKEGSTYQVTDYGWISTATTCSLRSE